MALTTLRQILDHAAVYGYGMPAFNITNLETMQAVMLAAHDTQSPVILQASQSARRYMGDVFVKHMFQAAIEQYPHLPVCVHQDHGSSVAVCDAAMDLGFSSVMMDGSLLEDGKTPSSYEQNVAVTSATTKRTRALCKERFERFGCAGHAQRIRSVPLTDMASRYRAEQRSS